MAGGTAATRKGGGVGVPFAVCFECDSCYGWGRCGLSDLEKLQDWDPKSWLPKAPGDSIRGAVLP